MTTTVDMPLTFTTSRDHARVVTKAISDLLSRCIRDAYNTGAAAEDDTVYRLAEGYGVTPAAIRRLITNAALEAAS